MLLEGPLIGRESELLALEQAVGSVRLVTITGAGGCGKTRVGRELAARIGLRAEPLDVVIVELAMVRSADHVVDALLRALGVRERAGGRRRTSSSRAWLAVAACW
jgi:predicted ATPase